MQSGSPCFSGPASHGVLPNQNQKRALGDASGEPILLAREDPASDDKCYGRSEMDRRRAGIAVPARHAAQIEIGPHLVRCGRVSGCPGSGGGIANGLGEVPSPKYLKTFLLDIVLVAICINIAEEPFFTATDRLVLDHGLIAAARRTVNLFAGHIFIFAQRTAEIAGGRRILPGCPNHRGLATDRGV
jgi:hypothetical protein